MSDSVDLLPSIGECASLACAWEVLAPKPGNVHRAADFEKTSLQDFITSAVLIGPIMQQAHSKRVGELVFESVQATSRWVGTNTNLGLVLLLAPLARSAAQSVGPMNSHDVQQCLSSLDEEDARHVFRAIRLAQPGGLGTSDQWDVVGSPPADLIAAMKLAAARDTIALQYANGFEQVFDFVLPTLRSQLADSGRLADAIVYTHVRMMAEFPDTLIARKCGWLTAKESAVRAKRTIEFAADSPEYLEAVSDLDFWLRSDGNRRNPGTTADLIGAGLFVALRNGVIKSPLQ